MGIAPAQIAVRLRPLGRMLTEVETARDDCRRLWWDTQQTTCLENQWAAWTPGEPVRLLDEAQVGARQIRTAAYRAPDRTTVVTFFDGALEQIVGGTA